MWIRTLDGAVNEQWIQSIDIERMLIPVDQAFLLATLNDGRTRQLTEAASLSETEDALSRFESLLTWGHGFKHVEDGGVACDGTCSPQ